MAELFAIGDLHEDASDLGFDVAADAMGVTRGIGEMGYTWEDPAAGPGASDALGQSFGDQGQAALAPQGPSAPLAVPVAAPVAPPSVETAVNWDFRGQVLLALLVAAGAAYVAYRAFKKKRNPRRRKKKGGR